jgi:hypothetical protein
MAKIIRIKKTRKIGHLISNKWEAGRNVHVMAAKMYERTQADEEKVGKR